MTSTNRNHWVFSGIAGEGAPGGRAVGAPGDRAIGAARVIRRLAVGGLSFCLGAAVALSAAQAHAQDPAPPPPPPAADTTPPPAPPPAPMPPPPPPGGVPITETTTPPLSTEAMPATRKEELPPITVGAWMRTGGRIQGSNSKDLDGEQWDTIYGELHAGGKIHKYVTLTLNINAGQSTANAGLSSPGAGSSPGIGLAGVVGIEDAILGLEFADEFHIWLGQMLVPVDRANYGGPFFMIPWTYPGFISAGGHLTIGAPAEGPNGRNGGVTAWGDVAGGKFKYAVGAFQTGDLDTAPLFSGRLSAAILGTENGYFGNETYFGDKDIVSVAVGGQYKQNGAGPSNNYGEVNADALMELKYGGGGWVSLDGAYYHFTADNQAVTDSMYVTAAIATPPVWVGNIQPMIRYQLAGGATPVGGPSTANPKTWSVDAFVNYLIKGPALRFMLGFNHAEFGPLISNSVQFGAQAIFF
jgi:hypothetical protein